MSDFRKFSFWDYLEPEHWRNHDYRYEHDFLLVSQDRKIRKYAPHLLKCILGFDGGLDYSYMPLPLVTALNEQTFQQRMISGRRYNILDEISNKYKLERARINGRRVRISYASVRALEPSQWNDYQMYAEERSIGFNLGSAQYHIHYPEFTKVGRILRTLHVDLANPGTVMWYECHPYDEKYAESKKFVARWSKFLKMLRRKYGFRFSEEEIEEVSNWVGDNLKVPTYKFELWDGDGITDTYRQEYFGSCMHESSAVHFYEHQDNVQILRMLDDTNHLVGRALVWQGYDASKNPVTILDRIYPSDGGAHVRAAQKYAEDNGWVYKLEQRIDGPFSREGTFFVDVVDCDYYPYMDSFAYAVNFPDKKGKFTLSNDEDNYVGEAWHDTSGYSPFGSTYECEACNVRMSSDEVYSSPDGDGYYCGHCFNERYVYSELEEEYLHVEDAVEVRNLTRGRVLHSYPDAPYLVFSEVDDTYYLRERRYSFRPNEDVVQLTAGEYKDDWTVASNAEFLCGFWVYKADKEIERYRKDEAERIKLFQ